MEHQQQQHHQQQRQHVRYANHLKNGSHKGVGSGLEMKFDLKNHTMDSKWDSDGPKWDPDPHCVLPTFDVPSCPAL